MLRNCRRTSSIMSKAARPTARIVSAEKAKGNTPPTSKPARTQGSSKLVVWSTSSSGANSCARVMKAEKSASAVSAAEPMANPLPIAAVVFPAASSISVRLRTSAPMPLISAMPPALSATGP
jgi:hypothetical protein